MGRRVFATAAQAGFNPSVGCSLKASGKNLDTEGVTATTVANVQQWDNCDGSNQHWVFEDAGDGWVYIVNKNGYYLDAQGGWDANHDGRNSRHMCSMAQMPRGGSPLGFWGLCERSLSQGHTLRVEWGDTRERRWAYDIESATLEVVYKVQSLACCNWQ